MRAIIVCGGRNPALHGLDEHQPFALIQLGDRPVLQHVIEYLIREGATDFDFILSHLPERIESWFGDGTRWGRRFEYHLAATEEKSTRMIRTICWGGTEDIVLASAESFPAAALPAHEPGAVTVIVREVDGQPVWSGWARFPADHARTLFTDGSRAEVSADILTAGADLVRVQEWISADTCAGLLASQRQLLDGSTATLQLSGVQAEKGAWIGRNGRIHPTARLQPPFWMGANCRVGARTQIGPYAVIGENCIIDDDSVVEDALVTSGTYIGQGLELHQAIVDRNRLVNVRLDATYLISEAFLAGSVMKSKGSSGIGVGERLLAALLLILLSPLWLIAFLGGLLNPKIKLVRDRFVTLPATEDSRTWRSVSRMRFEPASSHFRHEFLPGLPAAVAGRIGITGVRPRDRKALLALPADWSSVCLRGHAGLITEALVVYGADAAGEDIYSAEAYYCAMSSFTYNLRLLCRYARSRLSPGPSPKLARELRSN